ncbi:MAG: nucleoside phosphorylase [Spirochaetia bacterium]
MAKVPAHAPTEEGATYHIRCRKGDVAEYVLLPGDPGRTEKIAESWESSREIAFYREYRTLTGTYKGKPITTTSTGIGCPGAEICIHELHEVGARTCIRVGTTGSISARFDCGDLIIPVAAVRKDGTSIAYVESEFPAFADPEVVMALAEACTRLGFRYGFGLVYTVGSFYLGQGRPLSESGYWPSWASKIVPDLQQSGVTNIDMDTAGQLVVGYLHGMRMGAVLSVIANRVTDSWGDNGGEMRACKAATEAVDILRGWDQAKKEKGIRSFHPSLAAK